jgi:hypothetical protein
MKHLHLVACIAAPLLGGSTGSAQPVALDRSDVRLDQPTKLTLAVGSTLEIKGVNGGIDVVKAKGPETVVSIVRDAGVDAPKIEMVRHDRGVTFCAVYPSRNPKKANECVPGTKGRLTESVRKDSPSTRFRVELGDGVHVMGRLFKGDIRVKAGTGNVDVTTFVGNIWIVDGGSPIVQAAVSAQGNLDAVIAAAPQLPEPRSVRLEIVNGELRVTPPTTSRISYFIFTDRTIENTFTGERLRSRTPLSGYWGPPGPTDMILFLSTGTLAGTLHLRGSHTGRN